ncbi:MAG: hypothetical protein ACOYMA_03895 [Bacteroidia bacterium]
MKTILTYCHWVMVVIFIATIIPFHAFHQHEEDIHYVAIASKNTENHHCKLDENFCIESIINHCEHQQHLAESHEICFTSQYHFIKNITLNSEMFNYISVCKTHYFEQKIVNIQNEFTILLNNKGPPYFPII